MEKEFAYNIGDQVWLMHQDHAVCGRIGGLFYYKGISCVDYETISERETCEVFVNDKSIGGFELDKLFKTKEDLLQFL